MTVKKYMEQNNGGMSTMCKKMCSMDTALLVLRVALALVFIGHGIGKFMAIDQAVLFFKTLGLAPFVTYLVAAVEFLGGVAMLLGVFARYAGVMLAIVMIGAIALVKAKMGFLAAELDITLFAMSVAVALAGAGKYAVMKSKCCGTCTTCADGSCCQTCAK